MAQDLEIIKMTYTKRGKMKLNWKQWKKKYLDDGNSVVYKYITALLENQKPNQQKGKNMIDWLNLFTFSPMVKLCDNLRVERVKKYSRWFKVSFYIKLK